MTYPPADPWKQKRTELTRKSSAGIDVGPWWLSFTHSSSVSDMAAAAGFKRLSGEDKDKRDELVLSVATVWFPGAAAQKPNSEQGEVRRSTPFSTE